MRTEQRGRIRIAPPAYEHRYSYVEYFFGGNSTVANPHRIPLTRTNRLCTEPIKSLF